MKSELQKAIPMAEAFARLLHPFSEVVIHDLESDTIQMIINPFSRREVGDNSYLDRWDFTVDPQANVIGPYEKINYDGRKLKSISIVLRSDSGKAEGFLCINMDISVFENYQSSLMAFLSNNDTSLSRQTESLFKDDLYEQINAFVQEYCRTQQRSLESLSRKDKQDLILTLKDHGAFKGKNASSYLARILNISRATVYNYLKPAEHEPMENL